MYSTQFCNSSLYYSNAVSGELESKLYAKELTRDHHPDREDEKARIEAAGGVIRVWGVPRVNGILAVTRSIGDIYLKRYFPYSQGLFHALLIAYKDFVW